MFVHRPDSGSECNVSWHFNATLIAVSMGACVCMGVCGESQNFHTYLYVALGTAAKII